MGIDIQDEKKENNCNKKRGKIIGEETKMYVCMFLLRIQALISQLSILAMDIGVFVLPI